MSTIEFLYHYTTPDGLIGIVKSNTLWATSVFYSNDSRELIGGIEMAQEQLRDTRKATDDPDTVKRIDWLLHNIDDFGKASRTKPVFVCSLTTQQDQLSQWRAYCRGGGFAIGFPGNQLREYIQAQYFDLHECIYRRDEQHASIKAVIDSVAQPWFQTSRLPVEDDNDRFKVSLNLAWELLRTSSRIKDASFSEECESRIISQPERRCDADELHFRSRNGLVIPYTTVKLPDGMDFWGKVHIVVGPTPYPAESKGSVYDLVGRYRGHAIAIDISRTPYREW